MAHIEKGPSWGARYWFPNLVAVIVTLVIGIGIAEARKVAEKIVDLSTQLRGAEVWGLDFTHDGTKIAVGSELQIDIWSWKKRAIERTLVTPLNSVFLRSTNPIQFSPDGKLLAVCGSNAQAGEVIRIWNARDWSITKDIKDSDLGDCKGFEFAPKGGQLAYVVSHFGRPGDNLVVYDVGTWQIAWSLNLQGLEPVALSISLDGRRAAISGTVMIFPEGVKDPVERMKRIEHRPQIAIVDMSQHRVLKVVQIDGAGPIAWTPDSKRIAVAGVSYVDFVDPDSGERLLRAPEPGSTHLNVRFSRDGRYFFESDMNGLGTGLGLFIWDGERRGLLQRIDGNFSSLAISDDTAYLGVGGPGTTTIWRVK